MACEIGWAAGPNAGIAGAFLRAAERHSAFPARAAGTKACFPGVWQEGIPGFNRPFSSLTVVDVHVETLALPPAARKGFTGQILISSRPYVQCSFGTNFS